MVYVCYICIFVNVCFYVHVLLSEKVIWRRYDGRGVFQKRLVFLNGKA